jgi:hypothetical protein
MEHLQPFQISDFRFHTALRKNLKTTLRLDRKLENSEIPGQRRLDDKAKNRYASRKERDQFLEELNRISAKPQPKP